jgi:anti-sigma-K factor RskA
MRGGWRRVRQVVVVLVALAVAAAWVFVDHPLEGPVVLSLSTDHGVHLTDVLIIVPLVWAWRELARG